MPEPAQRTALYRLFDRDGRLLYVGITGKPSGRWRQHSADKPWWDQVADRKLEWFDARPIAADAEVEAISSESPLYNGTTALDKHGLYRQIADALRDSIYGGEMPGGSQLPSENALAERFSTTRVTVRKAIALLRAEGLVTSSQGKGVFVCDPVCRTVPIPVTDIPGTAKALAAHLSKQGLVELTQALVAEISN